MFDDPLCDGLFLCVCHLKYASTMENTYSEVLQANKQIPIINYHCQKMPWYLITGYASCWTDS